MDLIADTNIIYPDLMMVSALWDEVWKHLRASEGYLLVPAVVRKECSAKHLERCQKLRGSIASGAKQLGGLIAREVSFTLPEDDCDAAAYSARWDQLIAAGQVKILPVPGDGSIDDLLSRAIERCPPFDASGDGFRDGLIWLSVRDHVKAQKADTAFVSNDRTAFCGKGLSNSLLPQLQDEIGTAQLLFFNDLRTFLDSVAKKVQVEFVPEATEAPVARELPAEKPAA